MGHEKTIVASVFFYIRLISLHICWINETDIKTSKTTFNDLAISFILRGPQIGDNPAGHIVVPNT